MNFVPKGLTFAKMPNVKTATAKILYLDINATVYLALLVFTVK